jgi:hypothetical protein
MTNQDIRAELTQNLDEAEWEWLIPHIKRDAVILVSVDLDLLDAGEAIASDNIPTVERWINEALFTKPSTDQLSEWNGDLTKRFKTLIVQPYVLVQEKAQNI